MPTTPDLALHHHVFEIGDLSRPLLLLHGTGGDERDLLSLGRKVAPRAALLSPRGNVSENGALRFFKRFAEGVFDLDDVARRAGDLARWLAAARARYELAEPDALGFSNGANTAAAMLLARGHDAAPLRRVILLRAMVTVPTTPGVRLDGVSVLLISGTRDPIVPVENAKRLAAQMTAAGATVRHEILPAGHDLTPDDLRLARGFLE
jgi:phospholipase/carboxylesterase